MLTSNRPDWAGLKVSLQIQTLTPRFVFRINNSNADEARNLFIRVEDDGLIGYGEGAPSRFFGEYVDELKVKLLQGAGWFEKLKVYSVGDIERIWEESWSILKPFRAAQCALNIALWDLLAKRMKMSATQLALGKDPHPITTFATIGLSDSKELRIKVAELRTFPMIKMKMAQSVDLAALRYIREETGATMAVDANRAWEGVDLVTLSERLSELGVLFMEQPLPADNDTPLKTILPLSKLPIIADESCATVEDVERMPGRYSGFNIKLSKCGGLTPALRMLKRGRELGLRVMVGCRLESSLGIAAGAVVAQNTDYADLDGAWLLANDPFAGLSLLHGRLNFDSAEAKGFGVAPRPNIFSPDEALGNFSHVHNTETLPKKP